MIIETHAHLNDEAFKDDLDAVINKCKESNILTIIECAFSVESNYKVIDIANKYDLVYCAVGLHPENVNELTDTTFSEIEKLIANPKVKAIGECGLDYYWTKETKDLQKEVFIKHMELAYKYDLPLIIHAREAIQDTYDLLKGFNKPLKGVMHGFTGSIEMAKEFIKIGFYIGVGGVVTFKNANNVKALVKELDLNKILLETDCPYLTPVPFRGKRNDPSYIPYIVDEISNLKEISQDIIECITTKNAKELFKI